MSLVKTHELKVAPAFWEPLANGTKRFEVRKDDRGFEVGDRLFLREWKPRSGYTGRELFFRVLYVMRSGKTGSRAGAPEGLAPGFVAMSLGRDSKLINDITSEDLHHLLTQNKSLHVQGVEVSYYGDRVRFDDHNFLHTHSCEPTAKAVKAVLARIQKW